MFYETIAAKVISQCESVMYNRKNRYNFFFRKENVYKWDILLRYFL